MSFGQYCKSHSRRQDSGSATGSATASATASATSAASVAEEDSRSMGSVDLSRMLSSASSIKHTRRMGTVASAIVPLQRVNQTPMATSGEPRLLATHRRRMGSSTVRSRHNQQTPTHNNSSTTATATGTEELFPNTGARKSQQRYLDSLAESPSPTKEPPANADMSEPLQHSRRSQSQPPPSTSSSDRSTTPVQRQHHAHPLVTQFSESGGRGTSGGTLKVKDAVYAVLKVIGTGGSSVVYEVLDEKMNLLAIKKVDLSEASEAEAKGYINEIKLLETLQGQDRIIRMFDYELTEDCHTLYVVMERGDTDLASHLKQASGGEKGRPIMADVQRVYYWHEMLQAVQVIHRAGIIHSDLKPANFLIVKGRIKLIDFGIASAVQSDKTSVVKDTQLGTFNFMSPEAIQDLGSGGGSEDSGDCGPRIKISYKSDIWSLGCILYSMTYGKTPFADIRIPIKKLQAITDPSYEIPYPDNKGDGPVDPQLVNTIQRCLVRDPARRASVEELLTHSYLRQKNGGGVISDCRSERHLSASAMDMASAMDKLKNMLTPNTKRGLDRAMQKLSRSETNLSGFSVETT